MSEMNTAAEWPEDGVDDWNFQPLEDEVTGEDPSPATEPTPIVQGTPLPAHVDADVAEAVEDSPPAWFGIQWEKIPPEAMQEAWIELRRWVDRFIVQHNMSKVIRPCWFMHPDVVNELYATMCAEYKIWEEGAPGVGPFLSFQTYLPGLRQRLAEATTNFCQSDEHKWIRPEPMEYDEVAWRRVRDTVHTTQLIPRDDEATLGVRVVAEDSGVVSNVVKMGAMVSPDRIAPTLQVVERAAPFEVSVAATHHRDDSMKWQCSAGNDWVDLIDDEDDEETIVEIE